MFSETTERPQEWILFRSWILVFQMKMIFDESEITLWRTGKPQKLLNLPRKLLKSGQVWWSLTKEKKSYLFFCTLHKTVHPFWSSCLWWAYRCCFSETHQPKLSLLREPLHLPPQNNFTVCPFWRFWFIVFSTTRLLCLNSTWATCVCCTG